MYRRPIVIGNWKMHTTLAEAMTLGRRISHAAEDVDDVDVVLLPPVIWLPTLAEQLTHRPRSLSFGVQNVYPKNEGPITGEIGLNQIQKLARYVLIGHSERRTLFDESDTFIREKVAAVVKAGLHPVLCVGELTNVMLKDRGRGRPTVQDRKSNILRQLRGALSGIESRHIEQLVVCYEPLWAIGTGNNVPGAHVQAVIERLRTFLEERFGKTVAARIRTIYGGSVTPDVIAEYVLQPDVDGVLVGGASLKPKDFQAIMQHVAIRAERA